MSSEFSWADAWVVFIVAYKSAAKLDTCLQSISAYLPLVEVCVWDNSGPVDSEVRQLAASHPQIHWFLGSANLGFAAAVNRLAAAVPDRNMLLVNPDAELMNSLPSTLKAFSDTEVAAAAPMVDGRHMNDSAPTLSPLELRWDVAHRSVTLLNAICAAAFRPQRLRGTVLSDLYRRQPARVNGYLTGACLAIRRSAWNSIGPFDEAFFLYGEEADWQGRASAAGWKLILADEIGVRHSPSGTVANDSIAVKRSHDLFRAGLALQLEKRYGTWASDIFAAAVLLIERAKARHRSVTSNLQHANEVVVVMDPKTDPHRDERVEVACELDRRGFSVIAVNFGPLGELPRRLPASIRLVRRPWWCAISEPRSKPSVIVAGGASRRERFYAHLLKRGRGRTLTTPAEVLRATAISTDSLDSGPGLAQH